MEKRLPKNRVVNLSGVCPQPSLTDNGSGSQYHGELTRGEDRNGQGVLYLPGGAWYEGNWVLNEMHGSHGKYCFENVPVAVCPFLRVG